MKKESSGAGATVMKTNHSGDGAGTMFMNRRAPEPELCHFYDGSAALVVRSLTFSKKLTLLF